MLEKTFSTRKGSLHRGVCPVVVHHTYAIHGEVIRAALMMVRVRVGECMANCGGIGVGPSVNLFAEPLLKFIENLLGVGLLGSITHQGSDNDLLAVTSRMKISGYVNVQDFSAL
mgnify:CR=1 FL=1